MQPTTHFDPNLDLNQAEFREGAEALASTAPLVTLGTHNACNAKCIFCLEGNYSKFSLPIYKDFFEAKMGRFLANAEQVTFTGFGETLLLPDIEEFLDHINATLPRTRKIFTTNGTALRPGVIERLKKGNYLIQVSLHASHAALHEKLTLLRNQFDGILQGVRALTALPDDPAPGTSMRVTLVDVLTTHNIDDLPAFLRLAWDLRAWRVRASYMTMFKPEHVEMSCYFDQERANAAVREARAVLKELRASDPARAMGAFLPPLFGDAPDAKEPAAPDPGAPPAPPPELAGRCTAPWTQIYTDLHGSVLPCCFWGKVEANLKDTPIDEIWNGPFYQSLRKSMASGDPHPTCKSCVRYQPRNLDDLDSHVTSRPDQRQAVMAQIERRRAALAQPVQIS